MLPATHRMYPEGAICWVEHLSRDHRSAVGFYSPLLGLDPVDENESFAFLRLGGADIGAAYYMDGRGGWLPYLASSNAEQAVDRARRAGGTVLREATQVGEAGWSAWVADPEGTPVGIWQAGSHKGFGVAGGPGSVCRVDLHTRQPRDTESFLCDTFGLGRTQGTDRLVTLAAAGTDPIHLVEMDKRWGSAAPGWVIYFGVTDVEQTIDRVTTSGGRVLYGPTFVPDVGDLAVLSDSLDHTFGVVRAPAGPAHP